jgi:pimeloyl-ACP methyl ester carboxylesterase
MLPPARSEHLSISITGRGFITIVGRCAGVMRSFRHTAGYPCIGVILAFALTCVLPAQAGESKPTGYYVDVASPQAPLRLWIEEQGQGEPVLMIHGLGASTYTWRHLVPDLAHTHRIIAVDLKGAGKSDKPLDEAYGILDQAAVLKTLIDRKGLTNLTLVGHSLGGGVALALALDLNRTSPGMIKRLVLIAGVAYRQRLQFTDLLKTPSVGKSAEFAYAPEIIVLGGLFASYHHPSKITFETVRTYALPLREPGGQHALIKMAEQIVPPNLQGLTSRYRTIRQPTLMIWCAEDEVIPLALGRKLARELPHGHLEVLKGCGHAPQEEVPKETLALMHQFLK